MNETSRRKLLAVAGAGAAATTVGLTAKEAGAAEASSPRTGRATERVVAVVDDHRGSEVVLLVGEREVVVRDRDLVNRILDAAGGK